MRPGKTRGIANKESNSRCTASDGETIYHTPKTRHMAKKEVRKGQIHVLLRSACHRQLPTLFNLEDIFYQMQPVMAFSYKYVPCFSCESLYVFSIFWKPNSSSALLHLVLSMTSSLCYQISREKYLEEIISYAFLCFELMPSRESTYKKRN